MTHILRVLGLALVAMSAISVLGASTGQAQYTFTGWEAIESNHVHTRFRSEQTAAYGNAIQVTAGKTAIRCESITGEGTSATGAEGFLTLSLTFSTFCSGGGIENTVTVASTSCDLRFLIAGKTNEHQYTGTADVSCGLPGDAIHIGVWTSTNHAGAPTCEFTIDEQQSITGVTFTNVTGGSKRVIQIDFNSSNLKITVTKGGLLCGENTGTYSTTGTLIGTNIVKAFNGKGEQIDATVSG